MLGSVETAISRLGFKKQVRQFGRVKYHQMSSEQRYEIAALPQQVRACMDPRRFAHHRICGVMHSQGKLGIYPAAL